MSEVLWHESKLISTQFRFTLSYAYWIIKSKFMRIKFMSTAVMLKNCKITNKKEIYQQYTPQKIHKSQEY